MIDANAFLLMILYILGSILLVVLIVLGIKLINTINRVNGMIDELDNKLLKFDKVFRILDIATDNMALISDKVVDGMSYVIRKIFYRKGKGKDAESNE